MIIHTGNYNTHPVGSKAENLFRLAGHGCPVPAFFCVDQHFDEKEVTEYLGLHFPGTPLFSVRSSASAEDGAGCSFAGQFRTLLRVPRTAVCAAIRSVLSSADSECVRQYCRLHRIEHTFLSMHVIVQEMIEADRSGVLFTANPRGLLNETVIVLGEGTGDGVVEDRTDTTTYYYNRSDRLCCCEPTGRSPLLDQAELDELIRVSGQIREWFGTECDLEYALKDHRLWLLQARPITSFPKDAPVIVLDNSNIVESYPGITLPLTQSFIREAYYQVFKNLLLRLTGEPETVRKIDGVLRNMVDVANGRVYYRISSWYDVLLFLPFHKKIISVWQEMMGVGDRTVSSSLQGQILRRTRRKTACSFFRLLFTCPKEMERLDGYFTRILRRFETLDMERTDNRVLLGHYHSLLNMTVKRWDMTLVNDMYAFLFTGLLKAWLKLRHVPEADLAANRAVSGIRGLKSLGPIRELELLSRLAETQGRLSELRKIRTNEDYARYVREQKDPYTRRLEHYIRRFGDRNVEELKLESKTFRTDPVLLIRRILSYADASSGRESAPAGRRRTGGGPSPKSGSAAQRFPDRLAVYLAKKASLGIRNREKSRLNRSRLYGMMRTLALRMGENLHAQGRIARPEDIFWLDCEEIGQAAEDPALNLQPVISERRQRYEGFRQLPAWSRLVFLGSVWDRQPKNLQTVAGRTEHGVWHGTACSSGIVEGEVLLVRQPSLELHTKGRILVTRMTDPGWVFLIADAKAILSEKGSLLSHTAIISRELKKPAVVGIPHIMEQLKDNDRVRVDGNTGTVTLLKSVCKTTERRKNP